MKAWQVGIEAQLMGIVAEGQNGRIYLPPSEEHEKIAESAKPDWSPEIEMNRTPQPWLVGADTVFLLGQIFSRNVN